MPVSPSHIPDIDLTADHIDLLLQIAREALKQSLESNLQWRPDLLALPERLGSPGACFVTLYTDGALHGCIGSVEPELPLAYDVAKNAISAAHNDPRFPALKATELDRTEIEISILSPLQKVSFSDIDHLIAQIRPGEDGIMVERGWNRGLLLPQVWEKITDPYEFLTHIALKAHTSVTIYDDPDATVYVFQVYHFAQPRHRTKSTEISRSLFLLPPATIAPQTNASPPFFCSPTALPDIGSRSGGFIQPSIHQSPSYIFV